MFKKKNLQISVCIPVYNSEKYLLRCLESVKNQDFSGTEIILVNDCSNGTDENGNDFFQIVKKFRKSCKIPVKIVTHSQNKGLLEARRSAVFEASSKYITFLDSDDFFPEGSLKNLFDAAEESGADIVQGKMVSTNGVEAQYKKQQSSEIITKKTELLKLLLIPGENSVSSWNRLYRRLLIVDNKLRFCEGIIFEDVDFNFRISQYVNSIAFCKERTYLFRAQRDGSITNTINECRCAKDSLLIYESALKRITSSSRRITYRSVFLYAQGNMRALPDNEEIKNGYKRLINHLCDVATLFDSILIRVYFLMPLRLRNNRMIYRLYKKYYSS